jgi:hypothetical protein
VGVTSLRLADERQRPWKIGHVNIFFQEFYLNGVQKPHGVCSWWIKAEHLIMLALHAPKVEFDFGIIERVVIS